MVLAAIATAFVVVVVALKPTRPSAAHQQIALSSEAHFGIPEALRTAASASIGRGPDYRLRANRGEFTAHGANGMHMRFNSLGVQIALHSARVMLSLKALGYGSSLQPTGVFAAPSATANRATYSYKQLTEWFVNGPLGLEQGFTLSRPLQHRTVGPLKLAIAISGDVYATLGAHSKSILISRRDHRQMLEYGALSATDARGRSLHTSLQLRGEHDILLYVETLGAQYPIRIDPFLEQRETFKITNAINTELGASVALSADGNTALVGTPGENGRTGAAYVFVRSGSAWTQQGAKLAANDERGEGNFGSSVALSSDGNTALIGGQGSSGIGPSNEGKAGGAMWVFTRSGSVWTQQGSRQSPEHQNGEPPGFGSRVALSGDGNTALVGTFPGGGAWVFARFGSTWSQQAELNGTNQVSEAAFGRNVALSADGNTALIGGLDDNRGTGAVWAFTRSGTTWTQQGEKFTGSEQEGESGWGSEFGSSVAVSANGNSAIIGGWADNHYSGAIWAFTRAGSVWTQDGKKITPHEETGAGYFGGAAVLTPDGQTALVGGFEDDSLIGAVWVFIRSSGVFVQDGTKITPSDETGTAIFGHALALSADGSTALIGGEDNEEARGAAWIFQAPPAVTTGTASAIGQTSATLNAEAYPASQVVGDCHFEYGQSSSYGASQPCSSLPGIEDRPVSVSARISGLTSNVTYHFRIVATIAGLTSYGADEMFTTAAPALPEVGRCVKLIVANGRYKTANCTTFSTGENSGKFEWQPWPAANDHFSASGAVAKFETTGGATMLCREAQYGGEYSSSQSLTGSATFKGCEVAGILGGKCSSETAQPGEIVSAPLEARLGFIKAGASPSVGWTLRSASGSRIASFVCGETKLSISGSAVAHITSVDKMTPTLGVQYTASKGKQTPEALEGEANNILDIASANATEQAGIAATATLASVEQIEIKATP